MSSTFSCSLRPNHTDLHATVGLRNARLWSQVPRIVSGSLSESIGDYTKAEYGEAVIPYLFTSEMIEHRDQLIEIWSFKTPIITEGNLRLLQSRRDGHWQPWNNHNRTLRGVIVIQTLMSQFFINHFDSWFTDARNFFHLLHDRRFVF